MKERGIATIYIPESKYRILTPHISSINNVYEVVLFSTIQLPKRQRKKNKTTENLKSDLFLFQVEVRADKVDR